MYKYFPFILLAFICSCTSPPIDMTEEEIDEYVVEVLEPGKIYDVITGLRFSKEDEAYQVTEYSLNDTSILHMTDETTQFSALEMSIYYKDDWPIFIQENTWEFPEGSYTVTERRIYLTGDDILQAYERSADSDEGVAVMEFSEVELDFKDYNFKRPKDAIAQSGDFEMKFGEFLIINPESYLILDNDDSGWGIALYIMEGDMLLDDLYQNKEKYQGKTIFAHHEFLSMSGIERMIYKGGIVKD